MRSARTLIRLRGCAGRSESSLVSRLIVGFDMRSYIIVTVFHSSSIFYISRGSKKALYKILDKYDKSDKGVPIFRINTA